MKYFVIFSIGFCVLSFTNGEPSSCEENLIETANMVKEKFKITALLDIMKNQENIIEIANMVKEKFKITVFLDIIKIADKIKEKCPEIDGKMESTAQNVTKCLDDIQLPCNTFCSFIKKKAPRCVEPARELMESCMPDESKGIPSIVEKIILAIFDQACHSTVEEMLEWLNPCLMQKNPMTFPACKEVQRTVKENRNQLPSKSLFCQTIPKMKLCIKAVLDDSCPNSITKQAQIKMQDAIDKAMKDDCDAINQV